MSKTLTKTKFTIKDLNNLRKQVEKYRIKPTRILGRDYYIFIGHKSHIIPKQSLRTRLATLYFNLFLRNKLGYLANNNKVRLI